MRHTTLLLTLFLVLVGSCKSDPNFQFEVGDLLFQDLDCGDFCDAIEKVTQGIGEKDFSHVAMIHSTKDSIIVIEAGGNGVVLTELSVFLSKSLNEENKPKVVVGRVKPEFKHLIPSAKKNADSKLGKHYDFVFDIKNDNYYCSELIYYAFNDKGTSLFELEPMTFKDPNTKETFKIWTDYYTNLGVSIPEGAPGLNPGSISRSNKIDIVKSYY